MTSNKNIPWIEKYRPRKLDEIVGNRDVIDRFKMFSQNGNIPNFILNGPPGVGKTTVLLFISIEIFKLNVLR